MAPLPDTAAADAAVLIKFPREGKSPRESYAAFHEAVCDLAAAKTASNPRFGILGLVLTADQYDLISPGVPFVLLPDPGPPLPLAPPAVRRQRETEIKTFEIQQKDVRDLKNALLSVIQPDYISRMSEPILRMANRSVSWIMNDFLFERFGRLTPREMEELIKSLDVFYDETRTTISEHFALHINAHNLALANNVTLSERDKVAKLRASLQPSGLFTSAIEAWARVYPTIALQTFDNLQDAIQIADDNRDRLATTAAYGYSGSSAAAAVIASNGSSVSLPSETSQLIAQVAQLIAAMTSVPTVSPVAQPATNPKPQLYCFTHGLCSHSSKDCRKPADNHNSNATAKNTMGGAPARRKQRRM